MQSAEPVGNIMVKTTISIVTKRDTWHLRYGNPCGETLCPVCKKHSITQLNNTMGHIYPESKGGDSSSNNLIPICNSCNLAMGSKDMRDFTRNQYKRELDIPLCDTTSVPDVKPEEYSENRHITDFIEKSFVFKTKYSIGRTILVDYIRKCINGLNFTVDDIGNALAHRGISYYTPSPVIDGLRRKSIDEKCIEEKYIEEITLRHNEQKELDAKRATDDLFNNFFNQHFKRSNYDSVKVSHVKRLWNIYKRESLEKNTPFSTDQIIERIREKCGSDPSNNKILDGLCEIKDYITWPLEPEHATLLTAMP